MSARNRATKIATLGFALVSGTWGGACVRSDNDPATDDTSSEGEDQQDDADHTTPDETDPSNDESSQESDEDASSSTSSVDDDDTSQESQSSDQDDSADSTGSDEGSDSTTQDMTDSDDGPDCLDQQIFESEVVPTRDDIADLVADYTPDQRLPFAIAATARRYPTGSFILKEANNKTDCFEISFSDTSKAQSIITGLRTAVHECGHMIDLNQPQRFVVREDLQYKCDFSIATAGPPRKIILDDEFQSKWPKDSFKQTYLEELGDQTFDALLNEASQYINTLATSYAFYDFTTFDPIARDGVHAFYWYVARFLRKARMEHSADYEALVNDQCWRQLILTLWGRSQRYLELTVGMDGLGGEDDALLHDLRNEPELLAEIDRLRQLEGCQ